MPELIQMMVLFWLKFMTESTADWTVVKLQHPFRSTQMVEVVLVSGGGKSGGKSSQMLTIFPSLGCLLWWWWWRRPPMLYGMKVAIKGDEKVAKPSSMSWCKRERFGLIKTADAIIAKRATRRVKEMFLRLIFFSLFGRGNGRRGLVDNISCNS